MPSGHADSFDSAHVRLAGLDVGKIPRCAGLLEPSFGGVLDWSHLQVDRWVLQLLISSSRSHPFSSLHRSRFPPCDDHGNDIGFGCGLVRLCGRLPERNLGHSRTQTWKRGKSRRRQGSRALDDTCWGIRGRYDGDFIRLIVILDASRPCIPASGKIDSIPSISIYEDGCLASYAGQRWKLFGGEILCGTKNRGFGSRP